MALTREQFAAALSRRHESVEIPGVGLARIQSLTVREMRDIRASLRTPSGEFDRERFNRLDAILVAAALVDDSGNRVISETDAVNGFFDAMDGGPWAVLCAAVKRHTGWECGEDWTPVRAAAKN